MKKGKFGLTLSAYPIAAFTCVILQQPLLCVIVTVLAIYLEKNEWAGRQSLQALFLSALLWLFTGLVPWAAALLSIPVLQEIILAAANILQVLVYLAAVLLSVLALVRLVKGSDADLPILAELSYSAYGKVKPRKIPTNPHAGQQPPQDPPTMI